MLHDFWWYWSCHVFSGFIHLDSFTWMFEPPHSGAFAITVYIVGYVNISSPKIHSLYEVTIQCVDEVFV